MVYTDHIGICKHGLLAITAMLISIIGIGQNVHISASLKIIVSNFCSCISYQSHSIVAVFIMFLIDLNLTDAGYLQTGRTWVKWQIVAT